MRTTLAAPEPPSRGRISVPVTATATAFVPAVRFSEVETHAARVYPGETYTVAVTWTR